MTLEEIVAAARLKLDDGATPYLWSDAELVADANLAENEACVRANLIVDRTTSTYCRFELTPGRSIYSLDAKVLQVRSAYVGPYVSGITFSWDSTTSTLSDSASGFLKAGFVAGDLITVSGFTTDGNNGVFTISSVAAGDIVVSESTMTTEIAGDNVIIKCTLVPMEKKTRTVLDQEWGQEWQNMTGVPSCYITEVSTEFVVVPTPLLATTITMVVSRLPAAAMVLGTSASPEIPVKHHYDLVYWICKLAHEKNDSETFDLTRAAYYEKQFTDLFGDKPSARAAAFKRRNPNRGQARWQRFGS